jgi:serine/threonine protein kinase/TolB-like protein
MVGQKLSHYRILEQIGAGGMGTVYRAHDERLDRDVALKALAQNLADDQEFAARFRREARTLSKLNHPNIATVHDYDSDAGTSFLVMELIQGPNLARKLRHGPLPEKEILRLGTQLLQGLAAAHAEGIIHRDLKPGNLCETLDGRLKILDFGLARTLQSDLEITRSLATTTGLVGTLPYMAPEQLRGEELDARTDLYSTGVVLYEFATGRLPFDEKIAPTLIDSILHRSPVPPRELNPEISSGLEKIIQKALEKDPAQRFPSAEQMRMDLESIRGAPRPSDAPSAVPAMEFAHVLFMDIVGYSKLTMDEQQRELRQLQKLVRATAEFERAKAEDQLISLPTGDGMALAFFGEPEGPPRCAFELAKALGAHPEIKLRMGIHSGPVYRVADINAARNVAGGGINFAQRVMDCGDAGHILVSKAVADVLGQLSSWKGLLHDLGEVPVKHGVLVHIYNLYSPEAGNPAPPEKVSQVKCQSPAPPRSQWRSYAAAAAALLVLIILTGMYFARRGKTSESSTEETPSKTRTSIAVMGFENISRHPAEDWISTSLSEDLTTDLIASQMVRAVPGEDIAMAKTNLSLANLSSFSKDTLGKIRKNLDADYVVSGAFLAAGSQKTDALRIDFRLQNTQTGQIVTASPFSGTVAELPRFIQQMGTNLLGALNLTPRPQDAAAANAPPPAVDVVAKRYYSEGMDKLRRFDPLGARDLFERAIRLQSDYPLAHSALAEALSQLGYDKEATDEAKKAFDQAQTLPGETSGSIEARYYRLSSQWDRAIKKYEALKGVYGDEPAYALNLADAQIQAGKAEDALATLAEMKKNPHWKSDARIDYLEAVANESLSRAAAQHAAANAAAEKAAQTGARLLEAQADWMDCAALRALQQQTAAEQACGKSQQMALQLGNQQILARALTVLANLQDDQGQTSKELELRKEALTTVQRIGSQKDIVGALYLLANTLSEEGNNEEALIYCNEAIQIAAKIGDQPQLLNAQLSLAAILATLGDNAKAIAVYGEALHTARAIKNTQGISDGLRAVAQLSLQTGDILTAQKQIQESIDVARASGLDGNVVSGRMGLGDLQMASGDLNAARKNYQDVLAALQKQNDQQDLPNAKLALALLALEEGKPAEAEQQAREAAEEFANLKQVDPELDARNALVRALLAGGKLADAQAELSIAEKVPAKDAGSQLALGITSDRLKALTGKVSEAKKDLAVRLAEAQKQKRMDLQFQARLALAEIEANSDKRTARTALQKIEADASGYGFKLVANQAARQQQGISN